jgi:hypothetical protein
LVNFAAIWYILWLFGIFFPRFGMLYQEKSGNPTVMNNNKLKPNVRSLEDLLVFVGEEASGESGFSKLSVHALRGGDARQDDDPLDAVGAAPPQKTEN